MKIYAIWGFETTRARKFSPELRHEHCHRIFHYRILSSAVPKRGRSKRGRTQKHANDRKRAQVHAKERKRKSTKEHERAQKSVKVANSQV